MSPFKALYGREPPGLAHYEYGNSSVEAVDKHLVLREEGLEVIRKNLAKAQSRMALQANKNRVDWEFSEGDWVMVKLKPYR